MKTIKIKNIQSYKEYVCVLFMIYFSIDTLLFGTNRADYASVALVIITLLFGGFLFIRRAIFNHNIVYSRDDVICLSFLYLTLMASHVHALITYNGNGELQYYYNYILIFCMLELSKQVSFKVFCEKYIDIIVLISIFSILIYIIESFGDINLVPAIDIINKTGFRFHFFGMTSTIEQMQYGSVRLYGIFREPGVFVIYLSLALFFELFIIENNSTFKSTILCIAIVLSFSTAGYIVLFLQGGFFLITKQSKNKKLIKIILAIISIIFFAFVFEKIQNMVFGKLFVENDSLNSRIYSVLAGISFSMDSPIFGNGWDYTSRYFEIFMRESYSKTEVAFTNTYLRMAATYGWLFTIFIIYKTITFFKEVAYNKISRMYILLLLIWILLFSNEGMMLNPLMYIWMFKCGKDSNDCI